MTCRLLCTCSTSQHILKAYAMSHPIALSRIVATISMFPLNSRPKMTPVYNTMGEINRIRCYRRPEVQVTLSWKMCTLKCSPLFFACAQYLDITLHYTLAMITGITSGNLPYNVRITCIDVWGAGWRYLPNPSASKRNCLFYVNSYWFQGSDTNF